MWMPGRSWNAKWRGGPAWAGSARTPCSSTPGAAPTSSWARSSRTSRWGRRSRCRRLRHLHPLPGRLPDRRHLEPYKVDARRCLSYLTIELKGDIPAEFRPALSASGNRIYGCDICQEVCPFNQRRAVPTEEPAFQPREITSAPRLTDLLLMDDEDVSAQIQGQSRQTGETTRIAAERRHCSGQFG